MKSLGGSIPQLVRNPEGQGIKRLFFSQRDIALIKDKTVSASYGVLRAGTVMAENTSGAGGKGKLVPFVPVSTDVVLGTDSAIGVSAVVANGATGHIYVSKADSYKYAVGDQLYFDNDSDEGPVDCGDITAIDRTTSPIYADIACGSYTATNCTVAKKAYVYVETDASDPYSKAKYILDKDIDTGTGEDAAGALTSVVISNAILYKASLINCGDDAVSDLSAVVDGPHLILK